ncbi:MAG: portal protein, partial [candidate division WOR-3 bacterium]|nr:portal protein [candidate division WOR-3 bacterium]
RSYGVDSIAIDEGKNGLVDVIFVRYCWRVNRIIQEFASDQDGNFIDGKFNKLPKKIRDAYNAQEVNKEYTVVQGVYPREDFDPKLKGKRGAKYKGSWFLDDQNNNDTFYEEDYVKLPIAIARAIKVRNEVYGRASGSMLISTIRSVNYMVGKTIEIVEKFASPPLGTWNAALWGDSVLDTSAEGLTVFNQELMGKSKQPVFPLQDVGDPRGIIEFLIPYLNEKVTTAFKIDILLDFNAAKDMTATESMQRFAIRGKSLAGMLMQQKTELLMPLIDRVISLLWQMNTLGINSRIVPDRADELRQIGRQDVIIPDAVLDCIREGKPWYKVKFKGELDRLTNTQAIEKIVQALQSLSAMASLFPGILEAVEWYAMWKDINEYLGIRYFKDEDEFKKSIEAIANRERMMMSAQMGEAGGKVEKDLAQARKLNKEAKEGKK